MANGPEPNLPTRRAPGRSMQVARLGGLGAALLLSGCRRAPSYSILGSFFPVWLFCMIAGVILSFLVHLLLLRFELQEQLAPPLLIYPSIALLFALSLWLIFFS